MALLIRAFARSFWPPVEESWTNGTSGGGTPEKAAAQQATAALTALQALPKKKFAGSSVLVSAGSSSRGGDVDMSLLILAAAGAAPPEALRFHKDPISTEPVLSIMDTASGVGGSAQAVGGKPRRPPSLSVSREITNGGGGACEV